MNFDNTYVKLPDTFHQMAKPSSAKLPKLIKLNQELADQLQIDIKSYSQEQKNNLFSGVELFEGSEPVAMAYAGHQFGSFNPKLGDGRAILLGEVISKNGTRYDLHLKGSGLTPFSRRGDGRSGLGPVVREFLVSEAMHAMGVPTTRALSITTTGDRVPRQETQPGASMIRVALGHIRVGTFEYFLCRRDFESVRTLIDYSINRFEPQLVSDEDRDFKFFKTVAYKKLSLVAKWNGLGFIHGVMNTDNTSISGETIDYGPCAFMDIYVHNKVYSSIDQYGRYAFSNQANIALWNLSCLANCFIAVQDNPEQEVEKYRDSFKEFESFYKEELLKVMTSKLGIFNPQASDEVIINDFLKYLEDNQQDFTNSFRKLPETYHQFADLKKRLEDQEESIEQAIELMNSNNPYIIPRNHLIEKAIQMACEEDYSLLNELHEVFKKPFVEQVQYHAYTRPPKPEEIVHQTFCGT